MPRSEDLAPVLHRLIRISGLPSWVQRVVSGYETAISSAWPCGWIWLGIYLLPELFSR